MRTLKWSLFTAAWMGLMTGIAIVGYFTSAALERELTNRLHRDLETQALLFRDQVAADLGVSEPSDLQRPCENFAEVTGNRVALLLPSGHIVCDSHLPLKGTTGVTRTSVESLAAVDDRTISATVPVLRGNATVGSVRASMASQDVDGQLTTVRRSVGMAGVTLGLLATGIVLTVSYRIRRPLELMRRTAQRLAREDLTGNVSLPSSDEMSSLAGTLDQVADQLEQRIGLFSRQGSEQEAVLASMVEGVLAVDTDERVISLNAAGAELMGANPEDAKGRGLQEVIRNADLRRFVTRTLTSSRPIEADVVLRSDEERILQARGTSLRDARGRPIGAVIVLNDVTHLRRLENIRRDFVANVSHELKTPITSIKGFVETLLDGALHSPEDSERFLRIVAKQADRLNAIIEDLLALAKIEQADTASNVVLEESRLRDVLEAAIDECGPKVAERQISMQLSCDSEILARLNSALLEQAVINLLDNAIKYSEPNSEVHVDVERAAEEILIHVRDQGCGIEAEHLDRLFERFYRVDKARSRKLGGTGLGLSIVKHIIHVHGGHVSVESLPGKGSVFTVHLPI